MGIANFLPHVSVQVVAQGLRFVVFGKRDCPISANMVDVWVSSNETDSEKVVTHISGQNDLK